MHTRARRRSGILFACNITVLGGTQRVMLDLAQQANARGIPTDCVIPTEPHPEGLLHWFTGEGVAIRTSPAFASIHGKPVSTPRYVAALRAELRRSNAAVVNFHYPGRHIYLKDVLAARIASRRPCVVTLHHPSPFPRGSRKQQLLLRTTASLVDAVITTTPETEQLLLSAGVPRRKVHVIPLGITPPAARTDRARARAELGLPADAFVVSTVTRLAPDKRVENLIEAVASLPDPQRKLRVVVGGDGASRASVEEAAAKHLPGRSLVLGWVEAPNVIYAASDVFAMPSDLEGFGLVFVEAAFHGVPSIGSRVGGVPYVIDHSRTGLLVPPRDVPAIAAAVGTLRDDTGLCRQMGEAARERAHREFTATHMADLTLGLFERLLGHPL